MTKEEANSYLRTKYPDATMSIVDNGRFNRTNKRVRVNFTPMGKDYEYKGSYISVLLSLGIKTKEVEERERLIFERESNKGENPFLAIFK